MNILHLSDIHFGRNYERTGLSKEPFDKRNEIMEGLLSCIGNIEADLKPEHIVVTGDIAWWGKRDEYDEAREWFLKLLDVAGLSGKDLTFCVGNHDVNWDYGQIIDELTDETIDAIDKAYEYRNICDYEAPIQEYEQFCQDLGVEPYKYYVDGKVEYSYSVGYKDVTLSYGHIVRLIGFNTSMLSYGQNIHEEKMWIGQQQIYELIEYGVLPKGAGCTYSIALLHHAERFLHLNELCEYNGREATLPLLMKNVDLVLCGHTETGGVPNLKTQEGGGKILSAGATYYNDEHPNSFSVIRISDAGEFVKPFVLYMYDGKWKRYESKSSAKGIKQVKEIPEIVDIEEECTFVVIADTQEYRIPMRVISVYEDCEDKVRWCRLENNKEVTRKVKIACKAPVSGGNANAIVTFPRKKKNDSSSMLELEKYCNFLQKVAAKAKHTEFYIISKSGQKILQGDTMHINEENDDNEVGICILEKIVKIEEHFGVRLVRPDDVWKWDADKVDLLVELIEKGYTDKIKMGEIISFYAEEYDWMKEMYDAACESNKVRIYHTGNYDFLLYGKRIPLRGIKLIAEKYAMDLDDTKHKIETYKDGDIRKIHLLAIGNIKTYVVLDINKFPEEILDSECIVVNIEHTGIQSEFLCEKK